MLNLWQYVLIYWAYHSLKNYFRGMFNVSMRHYSGIPVYYLYWDLKKQVQNAGLDGTAAETHMLLQKEMIISLMSLVANCVTTSPRKNKWYFQFLWLRLELNSFVKFRGVQKASDCPIQTFGIIIELGILYKKANLDSPNEYH